MALNKRRTESKYVEDKSEENYKNKVVVEKSVIESSVKSYCDTRLEEMNNHQFFSWLKFKIKFITLDMLKCCISNLVLLGDIGKEFYLELISWRDEPSMQLKTYYIDAEEAYKKGKLHIATYDVFKVLGYDGETIVGSNPAQEFIEKMNDKCEKELGLIKNSKGSYCVNPNIFQKYFFTRVNIFKYSNYYYIYDLSGYYKKIDVIQIKKIAKHMMHEVKENIWNSRMEKSIWSALNLEIKYISNINVYTEYINLENGMYNIYTQKLEEHNPKFLSTVRIPVTYNPNAECPIFKKFLSDLMQGDDERILLMEEIMGYSLTLLKCVQKGFFFYGTGGNGKSKLAEVITKLCGKSNISNVSLRELGSQFGAENLPCKLINISPENEFDGKYMDTGNFKMITGGDTININAKFKKAESYDIFVKLISLVNKLPNVDDTSDGYFRRVLIVPFYNVFTGEKDDKAIMDKLLIEMEGILLLALEGLRRLISNKFNFTESKVVNEIFHKYRVEQNLLMEFFADRVICNKNAQIKQCDVLRYFKKWAMQNGYDDWNSISSTKFWNMFRKILSDNGIDCKNTKKIKGITYINGISIE